MQEEKEDYIKPRIDSNYYTCPHCNKNSNFYSDGFSYVESPWGFDFRECLSCKEIVIWKNFKIDEKENKYSKKVIFPITFSAPLPNKYMDKEFLSLFNEARSIFDFSPRSAGVLLRILLERKFRKEFDSESDTLGRILNNKKKDIIFKLGDTLYNALVGMKGVGNDAAHSSKMFYEDDDKKMIEKFFEAINFIFERMGKEEELIEIFK